MNRAWDAVLAEVDEQREQLRAVAQELGSVTVEATSTDRLVRVVINARGMLTNLHIDPLALRRHRADQLSALIRDLVARADGELTSRRNQLVAAIVQDRGPHLRDLD
ncbi:YbaB/EbfC family nucleoid-associated protein [Williamsia soli]|uniref:YbaB/EbfC family nucleoid-associated protein n=1 Tax=Williamsia soli TaxID=364929 RepID=UPI001A9FB745|nr:YbaB/EbfC family nucleoid-associated protein [Williamsia soli]